MNNIHLIVLLAIISCTYANVTLDTENQCGCPAFIKADCTKWPDCKWSGTACEAKVCADYTTEDKCVGECKWKGGKCADGAKVCADMPTEESCSNMAGCGWKDSKCIKFTQCSDFVVSKPERCNVLRGEDGEQCQPKGVATTTAASRKHLTTTAGTQCQNKVFIDCTKLTLESACKGDASATAKCAWKSDNKCHPFELKKCSDADGFKDKCDPKYCKLSGTSCVERTCADITTQALCKQLPKIGDVLSTLCQWGADNKCAPAKDTTYLTEQTCNDMTLGQFYWEKTQCLPCGSTMLYIFTLLILGLLF